MLNTGATKAVVGGGLGWGLHEWRRGVVDLRVSCDAVLDVEQPGSAEGSNAIVSGLMGFGVRFN
jgi:hypothetical protein